MSQKSTPLVRWQRQAEQLRQALGQIGLISQGSVQDRSQRRGGGAGYQWTRKVDQKTITVALTPEQFAKMKEAVASYRTLRRQLKQLEHATAERKKLSPAPRQFGLRQECDANQNCNQPTLPCAR